MRSVWTKVVAAILAVAAVALIIVAIHLNRPLVKAPKGTSPLDNRIDTAGVVHLVVDEAGVLPEETEKIVSIYNANWRALTGRCLAVVVLDTTQNAENEAWSWVDRLSLGSNDALLLIETGGNKECALVADGTFRQDLAEMDEGYLTRLTYMPVRAGDFDVAVLAVFERMHYLQGYDGERHRSELRAEGILTLVVVAIIAVPIAIHMIAEKIDNRRFKRWYEDYGKIDPTLKPWRTVFFWHRRGSAWYEERVSGDWVDYASFFGRRSRSMRANRASGVHMGSRFRR